MSLLIEAWKITKAMKVTLVRNTGAGLLPYRLQFEVRPRPSCFMLYACSGYPCFVQCLQCSSWTLATSLDAVNISSMNRPPAVTPHK